MLKKPLHWFYFRTFIKPQSKFDLLLNNEKYFSYGFIYILIPLNVLHLAEEMDEKVTNDEAQEILEEIEDNIDSEMGVTWTSLRVGIEDLIKK